MAGVSSTSDQAVHKEQDALEQALKNGAIRTYALTGTYPESLSQLLSDYHITYDKTKFVVEYVPNGSNLLPSISVIALSGSAKGGMPHESPEEHRTFRFFSFSLLLFGVFCSVPYTDAAVFRPDLPADCETD